MILGNNQDLDTGSKAHFGFTCVSNTYLRYITKQLLLLLIILYVAEYFHGGSGHHLQLQYSLGCLFQSGQRRGWG